MNTYQNRTGFVILILVILGLLIPQIAHAQEIEVKAADPNSAEQGTLGLDVKITGNGFAKGAKVRFFLFENEEDDGGILVNSVKVRGSKSLIVNIDVPDDAVIGDFNVEVLLNGRKGKGTARLFFVKANTNKEVFTCRDVFTHLTNDDICSCSFTLEDSTTQQGTPPTLRWRLRSDCVTHETLVIPQFEKFAGFYKLTAEFPFIGSSVIAAAGHRAGVTDLEIDIGPDILAGCGDGELRSAIAFVLDGDSADPNPSDEIEIYQNTRWVIRANTISDYYDPLCHAIEASRTSGYVPVPATIEGRVNVHRNVIITGSYEKTGILFRGFGPVNNSLEVTRNTIGAAAVVNEAVANAIQFGPILGEGTVERNLISLNDGTGVLVVGDGTTDAAVSQNDIEGAFVGVLVNDNVLNATIKSNILTGANDAGSVGVCSDAMSNLFRANKIKDYDDTILEGECSGLVSAAE